MVMLINYMIILVVNIVFSETDPLGATSISTHTTSTGPQLSTQNSVVTNKNTRRIIKGTPTGDIRPYMVYLKAASAMKKKQAERMSTKKKKKVQSNGRQKHALGRQQSEETSTDHKYWLCGGVIIHAEYVLTSAACIEDVKQFYVISGTSKWNAEAAENSCVSNGALRATWKCVDQDYHYDGNNYDNIQWMKHDIAVVRVERPFNFTHKVVGCEFVPGKIAYNNYSAEFEKPGTIGTIAGWGSTSKFYTDISSFKEDDDLPKGRETEDSTAALAVNQDLLETDVKVISKKNCKKAWDSRYHEVIDGDIICSRDVTAGHESVCDEAGAKCVDIAYSEEDEEDSEDMRLRSQSKMNQTELLNAFLLDDDVRRRNDNHTKRSTQQFVGGGFCENDHGGPLIVGHGKKALVVGTMTAAFVKGQSRECRGPFLYTSVYKNSDFINCAVDKRSEECRNAGNAAMRTKEIAFNWDI